MLARRTAQPTISRRAFTLVELLVVVMIMLILVAAAIPILRPLNADRKTREAARQVQTFLAEAKALAARRGRTVGVVLDCSFNAVNSADAYDPDAVTKLYLAEQPPPIECRNLVFFVPNDDDLTSIYRDPSASTSVGARFCRDSNGANVYSYVFFGWFENVAGTIVPRRDLYMEALVSQAPANVPFYLQLSGYSQLITCVREPGVRQVYTQSGGTINIPRVRAHSKSLPTWDGVNVAFNPIPDPGPPVVDVVGAAATTLPAGFNGPYDGNPPVEIAVGLPPSIDGRAHSPPTRSGSNVLELPDGVAIDLRCSGLGPEGYGEAPLRASTGGTLDVPISPMIMFRPDGSVDSINGYQQATTIHLLIGTTKRMREIEVSPIEANAGDAGPVIGLDPKIPPKRLIAPPSGAGKLPGSALIHDSAYGNLRDGSSLWVTIANRTGNVNVADNAPVLPKPTIDLGGDDPTDHARRRGAVRSARDLARNGKTKGGL